MSRIHAKLTIVPLKDAPKVLNEESQRRFVKQVSIALKTPKPKEAS